MLCQNCRAEIDAKVNFCPNCGCKIRGNADLAPFKPNSNSFPLEARKNKEVIFKRQSPLWFKVILIAVALLCFFSILIALMSQDLTDAVSDQLVALREKKITEAYYNFTSREFQKATSLENFHKFVEEYPIFLRNKSVRFIDRSMENDVGKLDAMLMGEQGLEMPVQYRLIDQEGKWKILSIQMENKTEASDNQDDKEEKTKTDSVADSAASDFDATPLYTAIKKQLHSIRQHNLTLAYDEFTSQAFKKETPFKNFEAFVQKQQGFSDNREISLDHLTFDNNIAIVSGILTTNANITYHVDYSLVLEDGKWKILNIEVLPLHDVKDTR